MLDQLKSGEVSVFGKEDQTERAVLLCYRHQEDNYKQEG